jgi:hypothetical protein
MNDLPEFLRDAMTEHTDGVMLGSGAARAALHSAGRARRTYRVLGAGAVVAMAGGTAAVVAVASPSNTGHVAKLTAAAGRGGKPPAQPAKLSYPTVIEQGAPVGSAPSKALLNVSVPDPAPSFPLRRLVDTAAYTGMSTGAYWADAFLVGRLPERCSTLAPLPTPGPGSTPTPGSTRTPDAESCTATGPEATVLVTEGPEPTAPNAGNKIEGETVTQTTTVDGNPAYVTKGGGETDIYFAAGRFAVLVSGSEGATVDDLTTLADSIHGLH